MSANAANRISAAIDYAHLRDIVFAISADD